MDLQRRVLESCLWNREGRDALWDSVGAVEVARRSPSSVCGQSGM